MNRPMDRGVIVDQRRYARWLSYFSGYRTPVTRNLIEYWLQQFSGKDRDLAARVLDSVLFITNLSINTCYRDLLNSLSGWDVDASRRRGRWFFVPFSGSVGESGDTMVHYFRQATALTKKKYNALFVHRSELVTKNPGPDDTVVLIDDFAGTGRQACTSWQEVFSELLTGGPRIILMLVAATDAAIQRISDETDMEPLCVRALAKKDNIFNAHCTYFTPQEKTDILKYCRRADSKYPKGSGDSGLLVVLAHRCPNNAIPILHAVHSGWQGLFPRAE